MSEPVIDLKNVNLKLGSGASAVHVLKDVDIEIDKGEAIGIVGPSGSGKTTLLMVLAGLERAETGTVSIAGAELGAMSEDEVAQFRGRNIGFVFQSFHLIANMTALENVAVPL
ncbi:MAG: ATP-binding cassette domain-containing protein, partial [Pseudomonadota bacterium]